MERNERDVEDDMDTQWADDVDLLKQFSWLPETVNGVEPKTAKAEYNCHILHRDYHDDWRLHPLVMSRVMDFCLSQEPDSNPIGLVHAAQQSFMLDDPGIMVIAIMRDNELIGHMLCERAILYFEPIVTIHQYTLDHGAPPEIRHEAVELVKKWARTPSPDGSRGPAKHIQWLVRDKKLATLYQRLYKAKPHLLLMRLPVEE